MDDKKTKVARIVVFSIIIAAIVVIMYMVVGAAKTSANTDQFAECLVNKGVKFYGAFWCPHCQAQEADFGMSRQKLASLGLYNECSNADGSQNALCTGLKITGYPTWVFPDGSRISGEQTLATLSQKSGCALPAATK